MNTIKVQVPKAIENLVQGEQERLLVVALRVAAKTRAKELARSKRKAVVNLRRLERKYGTNFKQFEKRLQGLDTVQAHEDYNDWFFWTNVFERAEKAQAAMSKLASAS